MQNVTNCVCVFVFVVQVPQDVEDRRWGLPNWRPKLKGRNNRSGGGVTGGRRFTNPFISLETRTKRELFLPC